jgi:hypothetical protein
VCRPSLSELVDALDIQDAPFVPPRFEPWRLMERIIANCAAVCIWVGGACEADVVSAGLCLLKSTDARTPDAFAFLCAVWCALTRLQARDSRTRLMRAPTFRDQIDVNVLPLECSYNACGRCGLRLTYCG